MRPGVRARRRPSSDWSWRSCERGLRRRARRHGGERRRSWRSDLSEATGCPGPAAGGRRRCVRRRSPRSCSRCCGGRQHGSTGRASSAAGPSSCWPPTAGSRCATPGTAQEQVELDVYRFIDGGSGLAEIVEQRLADRVGRAARRAAATWPTLLSRVLRPQRDRGPRRDAGAAAARGRRASRAWWCACRAGGCWSAAATRSRRRRRACCRRWRRSSQPAFNRPLGARHGRARRLLAGAWYFFLKRQTPSPEEFRYRFGVDRHPDAR